MNDVLIVACVVLAIPYFVALSMMLIGVAVVVVGRLADWRHERKRKDGAV